MDFLITTIFSAWFAVSVVSQFQPSVKRRVRWPTPLLFVVGSGLFAAIPRDLSLSYRDRSATGDLGEWIDVERSPRRRAIAFFWNPEFWHDLTVVGILARLARADARLPRNRISKNMWYLVVKELVVGKSLTDASNARQFRINSTRRFCGREARSVLFTSDFEPL